MSHALTALALLYIDAREGEWVSVSAIAFHLRPEILWITAGAIALTMTPVLASSRTSSA